MTTMTGRLAGKAAVITGAGSGFGRAMALLFAAEGARVVVAEINESAGKEVVDEVIARGGEALLSLGDVSDSSVAEQAVKEATGAWGRLDILVNNAGIVQPRTAAGTTWDSPDEVWDLLLRVNLRTVFVCSKAAVPAMRASGGGSIVNIASIAAAIQVGGSAYAAAKGGMISYTRQVAAELAPDVRVNCVSPGLMWTPMSTGERAGLTLEEQAAHKVVYGARSPMKRAGTVDDIAYAALFFASDESSYVTGRDLIVDGAYTVRG
jgi:NAD(P)-dependent dehydrogenase (short-subunit alcohol dehydrogenase family)